jgi:hypothetical protein
MGLKNMIQKNDNSAGSDEAAKLRESDGEQGFLSRWSRRKAQAGQAQKPQPSTEHNEQAPDAVLAKAGQVVKHDATDSELPPIDQLNENSDYSAFMSPKVSEHLRLTALRKLFHTPQFNVIDPVDQFALDWNGFTPLGSIVTHDMVAAMEREAAKLGEKARDKLLDANDTDPAREIGKADETQGGISSSQETALAPTVGSDGKDMHKPQSENATPTGPTAKGTTLNTKT